MKQPPANQLDPRVKNVWRINDGIWITIIAAVFILPVFFMSMAIRNSALTALLVAMLVIYVACMVIWLVVLPPIRYMRWRYEVTDNYLDIAKGIIWRRRYTIPFIRVQNTDTRQGPILRALHLATVTVSTAAEEHRITGLDMEVAEQLRDRAAELARLAREDV